MDWSSKGRARGILFEGVFALACLAVFFCLGYSSMVLKSPTMDEPVYLVGGVSYWRNHDYRFNPEAGILPQLWETIPAALSGGVKFPPTDKYAPNENQIDISIRYLCRMGNDIMFLLESGRAMVLLAGLLGGVFTWLWARRLFGPRGGAFALVFYSFSPSVIASASLATSDMFVTLFFLMSLFFLERALRRLTIPDVLAAGLSLAGLFLSKYSAFFIIPVWLCMMMFRISSAEPMEASLLRRWKFAARTQREKLLACLGLSACLGLVVFACVWGAYGFRYSSVREGDEPGRAFMNEACWGKYLDEESSLHRMIGAARKARVLPEAYLYGFLFTFENSKTRDCFLNGQHSTTGWWYFFPYCFLVKTPLPFLLMLVLCGGAGLAAARRKSPEEIKGLLLKISTPLVFITVFMLFAMTSRINIGERHILPVYPALFALAGGVAGTLFGAGRKMFSSAVIVLTAAFVFCGIKTWPHYLAYFNALAGGPQNGHKRLVDSSLDWGQDFFLLRGWLEKRGLNDKEKSRRVFISFFSPISVYYMGIGGNILPSFHCPVHKGIFKLTGGTYCISATMWQLVLFSSLRGEWSADEDKLFEFFTESLRDFMEVSGDVKRLEGKYSREQIDAFFRNYLIYDLMRFKKILSHLKKTERKPDAMPGYSILIFELSDEEVADILAKPAAKRVENEARAK